MSTFVETEVKVVRRVWLCDCGGEMKLKPGSGSLMSNPPKYDHQCDRCGSTEWTDAIFPQIYYVNKD